MNVFETEYGMDVLKVKECSKVEEIPVPHMKSCQNV